MEGKKVAIIGVLIAVIIVAVVVTAKRATSKPQPPQWVLDQQIEKIDLKTLEPAKERLGDWMDKYAPDASGHYKNPKTGEYTMVDSMKCSQCGALIPVPQLPPELAGKDVDPSVLDKLQADYKCPKCGKNPFEAPVSP